MELVPGSVCSMLLELLLLFVCVPVGFFGLASPWFLVEFVGWLWDILGGSWFESFQKST